MHRTLLAATSIAFLAASAGAQAAAALGVASYDMPNGDGQAHGGTFNYWDRAYSGSGATTTDGAPLGGGLGDLSDGITTSLNWHLVENDAGTGPYVGWRSQHVNPVAITFHFSAPVDVAWVSIHADDSHGWGGVSLPTGFAFAWTGGSASLPVLDPDPGSAAPKWLTFEFAGARGISSITVTPQYGNEWVFIDEVQFFGTAVPEPSAWALMAGGLAAIGASAARARRRRPR